MAFDLRQLRFAVAAADHGSFRRAALALKVEPSILSRAVRALELRLRVDLFVRSRAGVRPSPAGAPFLRNARRLIEDADRMIQTAVLAGRGEAGHLSLGFHTSLSAGHLRATLLAYQARHPDVGLERVERDRCDLFHRVEMGSLDLCIVAGDALRPVLEILPLWSERVMVALPDGHPLAERGRVYWTDLREETFALMARDPGCGVGDLLISKLAEPGYRPIMIEQDVSRENLLNLVGHAGFITIVSEAASGARYPNVVLREIHDASGPTHIDWSAYWRADNASPSLRRFLKLVAERYALPEGEA